jgi:hypothetical protein
VDLAAFTIEGYETSGTGVYGILVHGAWGAGFMNGICVHRPDQDCVRFEVDSGTGNVPDDWRVAGCKFSASRNGYGVYAPSLPDSWFTDCESSENTLDNWYLGFCTNTRLSGCKGENGSATGFHLAGLTAGETVELIGCTTNLNATDGFLFDNAAGGGLATYLLTGCRSSNDNVSAGAGLAGFRANGCLARIIGTGCVAIGANQVYGASAVAASYFMCFTGSWLTGTSAATHDGGTNTHVLANQSPVGF